MAGSCSRSDQSPAGYEASSESTNEQRKERLHRRGRPRFSLATVRAGFRLPDALSGAMRVLEIWITPAQNLANAEATRGSPDFVTLACCGKRCTKWIRRCVETGSCLCSVSAKLGIGHSLVASSKIGAQDNSTNNTKMLCSCKTLPLLRVHDLSNLY